MAESRAAIISALGIFQGCGNPFSCVADQPDKKQDNGVLVYVQDDDDPAPGSWPGRFQ